MAEEHVDEEFSLKDAGILLPYVRNQDNMNVCYAYTTGGAIAALFAKDKNQPPVELSIQQIADFLPKDFDYKNKGNEIDEVGCYFGSHIHALEYATYFGLCTELDYPKRGNRIDNDIPPVPHDVRYRITYFNRVRTEDIPRRLQSRNERVVTEEAINEILKKQPMVGAIRIFKSFVDFKGKDVYMGPTAGDIDQNAAHSILVIGYGVKNGTKYFLIKNSHGDEWGDDGYGRIRRDLIYRMCYPVEVYKFPYDPDS